MMRATHQHSAQAPRRQPRWLVWLASVALVGALSVPLGGCGSAAAEQRKRQEQSEFHYKLASGYFHAENIDLAIRELVRAFDFDPENPEARYLYGFILFSRKRLEEAAENFRRALVRNPKHFAARNHLGVTYLELERFHEAIEVIEPLLKEPLYTTPFLAHNNIGWAYFRLGNLRNAEKHLRMAVFINPKFCLGFRNLGLLAKEQRDIAQAIRHLEEATRLCGKDFASAWWELGELLSERDMERAQNAFRTCRKIAGDSMLGRRCAARIIGGDAVEGADRGDREPEEDRRGWR